MVVPSELPLKLICDVTRLWRNLALPSEIFCVCHCAQHTARRPNAAAKAFLAAGKGFLNCENIV